MFDGATERLMPDSAHFDLHRVMGAVPVTGANFYRLLADKEFVLLYPGGAREALHRKVVVVVWFCSTCTVYVVLFLLLCMLLYSCCFQGEEYKLFWPEQPEFVRMASRFGATIVPFGVVGEDDICHVSSTFFRYLKQLKSMAFRLDVSVTQFTISVVVRLQRPSEGSLLWHARRGLEPRWAEAKVRCCLNQMSFLVFSFLLPPPSPSGYVCL